MDDDRLATSIETSFRYLPMKDRALASGVLGYLRVQTRRTHIPIRVDNLVGYFLESCEEMADEGFLLPPEIFRDSGAINAEVLEERIRFCLRAMEDRGYVNVDPQERYLAVLEEERN